MHTSKTVIEKKPDFLQCNLPKVPVNRELGKRNVQNFDEILYFHSKQG